MHKKEIVVTKVNHSTDAPNHVLIYSWNFVNPLIAKPTTCLNVLDHFVKLALKGLRMFRLVCLMEGD